MREATEIVESNNLTSDLTYQSLDSGRTPPNSIDAQVVSGIGQQSEQLSQGYVSFIYAINY